MHRLALLVALSAAACGSLDDDRPATFPYIQAAILNPTCAKAECHSSFAQEVGYDFGSVDEARFSMVGDPSFSLPPLVNPGDTTPEDSYIIQALTYGSPGPVTPGTNVRMPYDEPMPAEDIKLIERWIETTDDDTGLGSIGAQCVPNAQGLGCYNGNVVPCSSDGNVTNTTPTTTCSSSDICETRTGTCVALN
jgi:hypothetical protein